VLLQYYGITEEGFYTVLFGVRGASSFKYLYNPAV
jgi:hypothetical protein